MTQPVPFMKYLTSLRTLDQTIPENLSRGVLSKIFLSLFTNQQMINVRQHAVARGFPNTQKGSKDFLDDLMNNYFDSFQGAKRTKRSKKSKRSRK